MPYITVGKENSGDIEIYYKRGIFMSTRKYASDRTGLLLVDPYNDFLS